MIGRPERGGWMQRRHQRCSSVGLLQETAVLSHAKARAEERLRGRRAEQHDHARSNRFYLGVEPRSTSTDVSRTRSLVEARLAAIFEVEVLDRVREVHASAIEPRRGERAIEKLACRTDERLARSILDVTGYLTD